jgi:hypothetical protein
MKAACLGGCCVSGCQGKILFGTGWVMDAMTGSFGCFTELLALTMKKVRTAAVVAAKTPEPTKKAARFLAARAPRKTGGGRLVKASFAS